MLEVKTVDDKNAAIRARKEAERELGAKIDRVMRSAETGGQVNGGCLTGLWASVAPPSPLLLALARLLSSSVRPLPPP